MSGGGWVRLIAVAAIAVSCGMPAVAKDIAMLIGNDEYSKLNDVPGADRIREFRRPLENAGFRVSADSDSSTRDMIEMAGRMLSSSRDADRLIIVLGGHVVSGAEDAWLMGVESDGANILGIGREGLSLRSLMSVANQMQGQAIIMVASNKRDPKLGYGLVDGPLLLKVPQGITMVYGDLTALKTALSEDILAPGGSIERARARADTGLVFRGFTSDIPFMGQAVEVSEPVVQGPGPAEQFWMVTRDINSLAAYEAFLKRFPRSQWSQEARDRIADIKAAPERRARADEAALNLTRDARRLVQRDLAILGFDPNGVDGVFGRGSRTALTAWQRANGFRDSGYLNARQRQMLRSMAAARAEELEREAEARRAEQRAQDRSYWRTTGREGTETGLRSYLERYPDGMFADQARARIKEIDAANRQRAAAAERSLWDQVTEADRSNAYAQYLERYPNGRFADAAKGRLRELREADRGSAARAQSKAEEDRVLRNPAVRMLVEQRLQQLQLDPGRVDGRFDDSTRRALRQFQRARNITPSGYVDQRTVVMLMTNGN